MPRGSPLQNVEVWGQSGTVRFVQGGPMRFSEKVCLVTGGGSGIGRATCRRLAAEGGKVLVVDVNEGAARDCVAEIQGRGGEARPARADVSDSGQVRAAGTQP